jgi:hypothetical protein
MRHAFSAAPDDDAGAPVVRTGRPVAGAGALPQAHERLVPWLLAAAIVAAVTLAAVVLGDAELASPEMAVLLITLCATLAGSGLVAARSSSVERATQREERARPARDELLDLDAIDEADEPGSVSYVEGMEQWTTALLELLDHAVAQTTEPAVRQELTAAVADTDALRDLLRTSTQRELNLNEAATLHSVCSLWETEQDRIEQLAAQVDPSWHRRWRARSVVARLLCHGSRARRELVLPHRS